MYPYYKTLSQYTAVFPGAVYTPAEFAIATQAGVAISGETGTVPASADADGKYRLTLNQVPLDLPGVTITVGGAARAIIPWGETVGVGEVALDMVTGSLEFNAADAGGTASATYTGAGTAWMPYWPIVIQKELAATQTRAALGPAAGGSTDNALARWDTTTGRLLQNSVAILTDAGALSGIDTITFGPDIAHQIVWVDGAKEWGIYGDATGGFIISADNGTDSPTVAALRSNANIVGVGVTSGWYIAGVDGHYGLAILNGDIGLSDGTNTLRLQAATITAGRTITFPDATGTVALTSDLGSYLPLTGGTLTGGLTGTTGTFTGAVQASRVNSTNTNTIHGAQAGNSITSATFLTCLGYQAGYSATTMQQGVFIGWRAGYSATTGIANVCVGESAGYNISTGADNVLVGSDAGSSVAGTGDNQHGVTTGSHNTAIGNNAGVNRPTFQTDDLDVDTTGSGNTALGFSTSWGGSSTATRRTAVGAYALVDEDDCIVLGADPATAPGGVAATKVKVPGALQVNGNATIGDSSGDAHTVNGNLNIASSGALQVGGSTVVNSTRFIYAGNGSASFPGYSFLADQDCGFYRSNTNEWGLTAGGTATIVLTPGVARLAGLQIPESTEAAAPTPPAGHRTLFWNTDDGTLSVKDSGGTVTNIGP